MPLHPRRGEGRFDGVSDQGRVRDAAVLGLDIGGTWTRALVVGVPGGARLGASRRAGANPTTHGVEAAAARIEAAIAEALTEAELAAAAVRACVVGMAGASKLAADPAAAEAIAALWRRIGLRCPVEVVADATTAFAAGSPESDGLILLAGTGAIAATMTDRRPVGILGGHGWLLGDEGSGFWIGREAVRTTLRDLDDGVAPSGLTAAIIAEFAPGIEPAANHRPAHDHAALEPTAHEPAAPDHAALEPAPLEPAAPGPTSPGGHDFGLGEGRRLVAAVISAANARPPIHLAGLVPFVLAAADQGDRNASRILRETAGLLVATLARARDVHGSHGARAARDPAAPIVLAGGILAPGSPVERLVRAAIVETWPKATVSASVDGSAGAAWLAALRLFGDGPDASALHARLLSGAKATAR